VRFNVLVDDEIQKQYYFHCPGCGYAHSVRVRGPRPNWTVSGVEDDAPTVAPSILVRGGSKNGVCHSFVKKGRIIYLNDCTHSLAGQEVDIPDLDE
jgi:hypothetical protein